MTIASGPPSRGSAAFAVNDAITIAARIESSVFMGGWKCESEIEDDALALGARDAQHHLVAGLALLLRQERVAMVGRAREDPGDARAADALSARGRDRDPMLGEHLEDGLFRRHFEDGLRARELDLERLARAAAGEPIGREELHVDRLRRPVAGGDLLDEVHEGPRTAGVEVRALAAMLEKLVQELAEALGIERVVEVHLAGEAGLGKHLVERRVPDDEGEGLELEGAAR